jgi:hypothetical protein
VSRHSPEGIKRIYYEEFVKGEQENAIQKYLGEQEIKAIEVTEEFRAEVDDPFICFWCAKAPWCLYLTERFSADSDNEASIVRYDFEDELIAISPFDTMIYTHELKEVVARSTSVFSLMTMSHTKKEALHFTFEVKAKRIAATIKSETALVISKSKPDFPYDKVVGLLDSRPTHAVLT